MNRQATNQELLDILQWLVETSPDLRFSQILYSYGFVRGVRPANQDSSVEWKNEFYTEPTEVLKRVESRLDE